LTSNNKQRKTFFTVAIGLILLGFVGAPLIPVIIGFFSQASTPPTASQVGDLTKLQQQIQGYETVLKREPNNINALNNLAQLRMELGQPEQAIELLERLRTLNSADPRYTLSLGDAYLKTRQFDKASSEFDKLLAISGDYAPALLGKGLALQGMGKKNEAQVQFDKAIKVSPLEMKEKIKEIALKNAVPKNSTPASPEPSKK
jgi:tetratricopeptide (TPR) repeat protein